MFLLFTIYLIVYCKKGVCQNLTQPLYLSKCHIINQEIRNRRSYYIRKNTGLVQKENPCI